MTDLSKLPDDELLTGMFDVYSDSMLFNPVDCENEPIDLWCICCYKRQPFASTRERWPS